MEEGDLTLSSIAGGTNLSEFNYFSIKHAQEGGWGYEKGNQLRQVTILQRLCSGDNTYLFKLFRFMSNKDASDSRAAEDTHTHTHACILMFHCGYNIWGFKSALLLAD